MDTFMQRINYILRADKEFENQAKEMGPFDPLGASSVRSDVGGSILATNV